MQTYERKNYDWHLSNPFEQASPKFTDGKGANASFLQRTNQALTSEVEGSGWTTNPRGIPSAENRRNFKSRDLELTKQNSFSSLKTK